MAGPLRRTPKASGLTERFRPSCLKCLDALLGGSIWASSHPRAGLPGQGGDEGVDGPGVLDVPEQLAAPAAGDVAPVVGGFGVHGGDAPPPPRHGDGGAVPTGQERHAPVGESESSAPVDGPGHEAEPFEGVDELGRAALGDGHQARQLRAEQPGPVVDKVEGALLRGFEKDGQSAVCVRGAVAGQVRLRGVGLHRQLSPGSQLPQGVAEVRGGTGGGGAPYLVLGSGEGRVPFQRQQRLHGAGQHLAGVSQPHLVGDQDEDRSGARPVSQLPEPP